MTVIFFSYRRCKYQTPAFTRFTSCEFRHHVKHNLSTCPFDRREKSAVGLANAKAGFSVPSK